MPIDESLATPRSRAKLWVFLFAATFLIFAAWKWNLKDYLQQFVAWVQDKGTGGLVVYALVYIGACVLFIPGSILTLGAGFLFGVAKGTALVSISAAVGATLSFLAGRYLARDWVSARVAGNSKFKSIDDAVAREGWKIVGLTRLSPVFPFNLLNYGYGLTRVSLRDYFFATWIGTFPGTLLYVYLGSAAGSLASLGEQKTSPWVTWVGLGITLFVTIYITRVAKRALDEQISADPSTEESGPHPS